jgi:hypothetical protein
MELLPRIDFLFLISNSHSVWRQVVGADKHLRAVRGGKVPSHNYISWLNHFCGVDILPVDRKTIFIFIKENQVYKVLKTEIS